MSDMYIFDVGLHNEQAHDYITVLHALARKHKTSGNPTDVIDRKARVSALCEAYFNQIGSYPHGSALSRLGSLILLDELTDTHPDKMSRDEYPIMSVSQAELRFLRERAVSELSIGDRRYTGRRKTHFTDDYGAPQVRNSKMPDLLNDEYSAADERLDLAVIIEKARLTDRQKLAIWLVYFEDMTQEDAAEIMGVSRRTLRSTIDDALTKIRREIPAIYGT